MPTKTTKLRTRQPKSFIWAAAWSAWWALSPPSLAKPAEDANTITAMYIRENMIFLVRSDTINMVTGSSPGFFHRYRRKGVRLAVLTGLWHQQPLCSLAHG